MQIKFLKDDTVFKLKSCIFKITKNYQEMDSSWIKDITNDQENYGIFKKNFDDFNLIISESPEKDDLENMKIIYTKLQGLTDSQASDERLWAGLCHDKCWTYMQKRWPLPSSENKQPKFILQHYFFNNGARSLLLNGVARLWWYARLTYDETNLNNPFELTEYLAKDINGKAYMLFGSNFSNNRRLQRIFLYTLKNYEEKNNVIVSRDEFNYLRKKVVILSGKILIDIIDDEDFKNILENELNKMIKNRDYAKNNF